MTSLLSPVKPFHWTHWVATGFGSGLAAKAPGTFGTVAAVPVVFAAYEGMPLWAYGVFVIALILFAVFCAGKTQRDFHIHDPGFIVIDEWAGLAVSMLALPHFWCSYVAAFLVFRLFDITKPWPINIIDRELKGGWGNVMDDVVAGIFTCLSLHILCRLPMVANWLASF